MLSFSVRLDKEVYIFFFLKAAWNTELQTSSRAGRIGLKGVDNRGVQCTIYKNFKKENSQVIIDKNNLTLTFLLIFQVKPWQIRMSSKKGC